MVTNIPAAFGATESCFDEQRNQAFAASPLGSFRPHRVGGHSISDAHQSGSPCALLL